MKTFLIQFLGSTDISTYLAAFAYALIGALIGLGYQADTRNKRSRSTPNIFSWRFLIKDNIAQMVVGFLLTFVAFRFAVELFGMELTMFKALLVGLSTNSIAEILCKAKLTIRSMP